MIFAAGLGSRLKPLTDTKPKALVNIGDKTLLQLNIEQIIAFGIKDIVVNVHHFSEQVKSYLNYHNNFGVNIMISDEMEKLLDTGGGLRKASAMIDGDEPILLQNVDIFTNINYGKILKQHTNNKSLATLAVQNRDSSRYLMFDKNMQLCGWHNTKTNEKIITRTVNTTESLAFSGVHIISPKMLGMLPKVDVFGIIDTYLELSKNHLISGYSHDSDYWFDVGTPEKLNNLEQFLVNNC